MSKMVKFYNIVRSKQLGATATEYAILVSLIAIIVIAGATLLGNTINAALEAAAGSMP